MIKISIKQKVEVQNKQNNINQQIDYMFFFCQDVKVYNCEYHYQCTRNPTKNSKPRQSNKINSISMNPNSKQSHPSIPSTENTNEQPTLLQKLRRRSESLQTTLYTTMNKKMTQDKITTNGQTIYTVLDNRSHKTENTDDIKFMNYKNEQNFSFCLPRQVLDSQTFHKQATQSEINCIIEEESQLIQPTINGKFIYISSTYSNSQYEQHLGIDTKIGILVSIKKLLQLQNDQVYQQLQIYRKIGIHDNILSLYQVCLQDRSQVFIKEPYINGKPLLADRDQLRKDITCALQYLQSFQIYLDLLKIDDIRQTLGVWKISNFPISNFRKVPIKQNIGQLISQIL